MSELVAVDLDVLPRESAYRPIARQAWYSRSLPLAVGLGLGIGLLSTWLTPAIVWLSLIGLFGWSITRRRRMYRFLRDNDDGVALLVAGELQGAGELFDRLCVRARRMPALHSLFVYNRGVTYLERGDPDRAVGLLSAVVHAGWIGPRGALSVYYPNLLGRLAMAEALRGRLEEASAWRARSHAATSSAKQGSLLLVDAVVEARHEAFSSLAELVEDGWSRAENLLTTRQLRAVRVLQAFALEHSAAPEYRAHSREADFRRALESARDAGRGEFDFLAVKWPQLRQFLDRHSL